MSLDVIITALMDVNNFAVVMLQKQEMILHIWCSLCMPMPNGGLRIP